MRGDSSINIIQIGLERHSPRVRGWLRLIPSRKPMSIVFPAHAGLIPPVRSDLHLARGVFPARAGCPLVSARLFMTGSLHTRGGPSASMTSTLNNKFPAYAGMNQPGTDKIPT